MVKRVKIGNKEYDMKASVLTLETYKRLYDKDLMKVVADLNSKYSNVDTDDWLAQVQPIVLDILKIAHIMIQEQNPSFMSYEDWVKDLDNILENPHWIVDVLGVAMSPFRTRIFEKQN